MSPQKNGKTSQGDSIATPLKMMRSLIAYCVDAAIADRLNDSDDAIIDRVFVNDVGDGSDH